MADSGPSLVSDLTVLHTANSGSWISVFDRPDGTGSRACVSGLTVLLMTNSWPIWGIWFDSLVTDSGFSKNDASVS